MADNKPGSNIFLFWIINPDKLKQQVEQYNTLKIYQSARGVSFLWLIFSMIVSMFMISWHLMPVSAMADVALFLFFGFFIYLGYPWAMIGAMILWTVEKIYSVYTIRNSFVVQLIWWAIYMHYFYLAYRVERQRRAQDKG